MNLVSDDFRIFAYVYHRPYKIGKSILASSETNLINLPPYVFDVNHVAKFRSELLIAVLEKKNEQNYRLKK